MRLGRRRCELAILPPCARLLQFGFKNITWALRRGKERIPKRRIDVKFSAHNYPHLQIGCNISFQSLEVCKWQARAGVAELRKLNPFSTDSFTTRSGVWATTCAAARPAIAGEYSSGGPGPDIAWIISPWTTLRKPSIESPRKLQGSRRRSRRHLGETRLPLPGKSLANMTPPPLDHRLVWRKRRRRLMTTTCAQSVGAAFTAGPTADGTSGW